MQTLKDRCTAPFVGRGRNQPARLVQHEINPGLRPHGPTIHLDPVAFQIDALLRIALHDPLDPDPTCLNQRPPFAAGAESELRQSAGETRLRAGVSRGATPVFVRK